MVSVDAARIAALRERGDSWAAICRETGLSKGTAQRALRSLSKKPAQRQIGTSELGLPKFNELSHNPRL